MRHARFNGAARAVRTPAWEHRDYFGWHEQGDGRLFVGLSVENGRIRDTETVALKSALREIVARFPLELVATPQQNVLLIDVPREARASIDAILAERGVRSIENVSSVERHAMACPALPTCGLALAEAERSMPALVDMLEARLQELGLEREPISIRMTGCPNGCARPYMAEVGIVGVSADRYNVYLGGSTQSVRLNRMYEEMVPGSELTAVLDDVFSAFARERKAAESFGDFCNRTVFVPVGSGVS